MSGFKRKQYLILDPRQALAGEITAQSVQSSEALMIKKIEEGIHLVLKDGIRIVKLLQRLNEEHQYELVFHTQLTENEQVELLDSLNQACLERELGEFPRIAAMTVRDNITYDEIDISNPIIIKNREHGTLIAGYGLSSYDNIESLDILDKLLEIADSEKQKCIYISNSPLQARLAKRKGWKVYGSSSISISDTLKNILECFESQEKPTLQQSTSSPSPTLVEIQKFDSSSSNRSEKIPTLYNRIDDFKSTPRETKKKLLPTLAATYYSQRPRFLQYWEEKTGRIII